MGKKANEQIKISPDAIYLNREKALLYYKYGSISYFKCSIFKMMSINCIHRFPLPAVLLYKIMQEYTVSEEFFIQKQSKDTL